MAALRKEASQRSAKHLLPFGHKVYSQTDEDGILAEIFRRIGTTTKTFIEFGIGDGLENNTVALLFDGWRGLWIDASTQHVQTIRSEWASVIAEGRLTIVESFITINNINDIIRSHNVVEQPDLLSVDIDGNDWHVLNAINCVQPRVIVVEYNAKFIPPLKYCMSYQEDHAWTGDDNHSASLQFFEEGLRARGYSLVGCSISGANAFFVRSDLVGDLFLEPFTAEEHYQPARYYMCKDVSGHRPGYDTLRRALLQDR